jgi:hypothetical protein
MIILYPPTKRGHGLEQHKRHFRFLRTQTFGSIFLDVIEGGG